MLAQLRADGRVQKGKIHMPSKATIRYNDYTPERSTVQVTGTTLSAANFDAQSSGIIALMDAIAGITIGLRVGYDFGNTFEIVGAGTPAENEYAQREAKWLVKYHEVTGGAKRSVEIPCPDLSKLDPNARGKAEIGDGAEVDAFVSAFEAFVKTDSGGNVVVDEIVHVGRNI
jgi:hypothetical protein